jgi:hypothetical protein
MVPEKSTSESVETTLIGGWDHLRDVHAKRGTGGGVTFADGNGGFVIQRTVIEGVDTVSLGLGWGRKVVAQSFPK